MIRPGKRINITETVANGGKEKSEPVKLKYVESGGKAGETRFYRVQAIDPAGPDRGPSSPAMTSRGKSPSRSH